VNNTRPSAFLKRPHAKRAGELHLNWNQLIIIMKLLTGHCHLNGYLFKQGLVDPLAVVYANRHLEWLCMLLVTVRH